MHIFTSVFRLFLLAAIILLGVLIWNNSSKISDLKTNYYDSIHVDNELLNPAEWKNKFKTVVLQKVDEFSLNSDMLDKMLHTNIAKNLTISDEFIESIITVNSIDKALVQFVEKNIKKSKRAKRIALKAIKKNSSTFAKIIHKQGLVVIKEFLSGKDNAIVDDIKMKVRGFILENKSEVEKTIKEFVLNEFEAFIKFYPIENEIAPKFTDPDFDQKLTTYKAVEEKYLWAIFAFVFVVFVALYFLSKMNLLHYFPFFQIDLLFINLGLLILGVSLPMISIVANLDSINFEFMGARVDFYNQNLIYRSKSVLQVFEILFNQGLEHVGTDAGRGLKLIGVAIFIILFSVAFPIIKMMSVGAYYFLKGTPKKFPSLYFLSTKLGKWAMADVFVVAVLLSFLGINGFIDNQMDLLSEQSISNNASTLDPGFYLFLTYSITSIIMTRYFVRGKEVDLV